MKPNFIMQMRPLFEEEEKMALEKYMNEDGFITEYERTTIFENMIANFTKSKHCIVVNNGTISLTLAAMAAGIKADDEVIIPNYTMIATPNSVRMFGAKPVFVDVEKESLCLDFKLMEKAITKKTKGIFFVSSNGRYPNKQISEFEKFAKDNNLILLEDAAQSLGSFYPDGRHIGTAGLIGSFSFSSSKIISTGQGGALITDNDDMADKLRKLKDFGRSEGGNDIHDHVGFNFKFTELQACIGIEQMKKLPKRIKRKKEIFKNYKENLKDCKKIELFDHNLRLTAPWFIDSKCENRNNLMQHLKEKGIGTRVMYPPINKQKIYFTKDSFPVSNKIGKEGLWLPSSIQLSSKDIKRITDEIINFYEKKF